ncbi:MAG: hypothetical protein IPI67_41090 [Myxococcales bacterium]|nr:hypothetical protein [Myxococcales bacterium]
MTLSWKRSDCAIAALISSLGLGAGGCASAGHGALDTTAQLDSAPRRAPGVAVDPASELPAPASTAHSEQGVVVLKTPADPAAARELVRSFFRAVSHASLPELEPLLSDDAWLSAGPMTGRQKARQYWQLRLSRLDYGSLAAGSVYRDSEIETYRAVDLGSLRPPRALGVVAQPDDVVVRVPIANPRGGKTRLFGDEIVFVLRPAGGNYRIVDMAEDFSLP